MENVHWISIPTNPLFLQKYNAEKTVGRDEATVELQKSLAALPAFNGVFFHVKVSFYFGLPTVHFSEVYTNAYACVYR